MKRSSMPMLNDQMAIGRENHISIESYANDRKHILRLLYFSLDTTLIML